jgi:hypothetical protein
VSSVDVVVAGVPLAIQPSCRVSDSDRAWLEKVADRCSGSATRARFRLELVDPPDATSIGAPRGPGGTTATLEWLDGRLHVRHPDFGATLDPAAGAGQLWRKEGAVAALGATVGSALRAYLPFVGGLPLHAAGVVVDGRAIVFFGPSGAGKSTLAASARSPVLSDELVAVYAREREAFGTGIWGTLGERPFPRGGFDALALVELHKGPRFALERLAPRGAFQRLLGVLLTPSAAPIWTQSIAVLAGLCDSLPVYRMTWAPTADPWDAIASELRIHA